MGAHLHASSKEVLERLHHTMNQHDLAGFVACFGPDYRSEQPAHPTRGFGGREQVEKNWTALFAGIPDFHAELVAKTADGDTVWAEWRWFGTRAGEPPLEMRGVTVFGVEDGLIAWGRLYMEEVEAAGEDIDETVRRLAGPTRLES
jgi:limonene-1,2-epoxide hydrolase